MLGQPVYFLTPEVVGVYLTGACQEGVTATDLVLHVTQMLRKAKVVGKFVEFYGPVGARSLPWWIARPSPTWRRNMARRWASSAWTKRRRATSPAPAAARNTSQPSRITTRRRGLWGIPDKGQIEYSVDLELDISTVVPGVAGPKRPQDRIVLPELGSTFRGLFTKAVADGGYGKKDDDLALKVPIHLNGQRGNGSHDMLSTDAPAGVAISRKARPHTSWK